MRNRLPDAGARHPVRQILPYRGFPRDRALVHDLRISCKKLFNWDIQLSLLLGIDAAGLGLPRGTGRKTKRNRNPCRAVLYKQARASRAKTRGRGRLARDAAMAEVNTMNVHRTSSRRRDLLKLASLAVAAVMAAPRLVLGQDAQRVDENDQQARDLEYTSDATRADKKKFTKYEPGQMCANRLQPALPRSGFHSSRGNRRQAPQAS